MCCGRGNRGERSQQQNGEDGGKEFQGRFGAFRVCLAGGDTGGLDGTFAGSARMARLPPPMFASYGPAMLPFVPSVDHITSIPSFVKQTDG